MRYLALLALLACALLVSSSSNADVSHHTPCDCDTCCAQRFGYEY